MKSLLVNLKQSARALMISKSALAACLLLTAFVINALEKNNSNCLPLVDVSGPLHVERDQFGRPTVVGTPACGPKHGQGSYWYQVGRLFGQAEAQSRFATLVNSYLTGTGRLAEFAGEDFVGSDINARRITFTRNQFADQIGRGLQNGKIPSDVIDVVNGLHQGYLDHIAKIEQGLEPLPADFKQDSGIFYWWWQERTTSAPSTFTVANFVACFEYVSTGTGGAITALTQLGNLFQLLDPVSVDPSGGVDANLIYDDILGIGSAARFEISKGDLAGEFCPTNKNNISFVERQPASLKRNSLLEKKLPIVDIALYAKIKENHKKSFALKTLYGIELGSSSGGMAISSQFSKGGSTLFFGNPQVPQGFNFTPPGAIASKSWITPRGSTVSGGLEPNTIRSGPSGYTVTIALQDARFAARDAIWEDTDNLTLLFDEATNTENIPGGKNHSLIKIRQPLGTVIDTFTTIYQGTGNRKSLELDARVFGDEGPICMQRFVCNYDDEAAVILKWAATIWGLVPFSSIEEFVNELIIGTWWYGNSIGIDNKKNIFTFTTPPVNTKAGVIADRTITQDATASGFVSSLAARPMPAPADSDYICSGPRLVKNPPCGFITGWNDVWDNSDTNTYGSFATSVGLEYTRSGALYKFVNDRIAEKGKLSFEDIVDAWSTYQIQRNRRVTGGAGSGQNYGADPFPVVFRADFFAALDAKGLSVGLTPEEIGRTKLLLSESYDGRSIPNIDITDKIEGNNFDGRWVLSQLWASIVGRNLWRAAVADPLFREVSAGALGLAVLDIIPSNDWTIDDPSQSRVSTVSIATSMATQVTLLMRALKIGPDLGNPVYYPWAQNAGLTTPDAIQTFIAQALKDALELQVTGANAGTGLENPNLPPEVTPRANLNLIQENGIPLHPGWGKGQRPTTLPFQLPYFTLLLQENFELIDPLTTLNTMGQLTYAERDCRGCLKHLQNLTQLGYASLITSEEINGETVLTVQPHATDQSPFFQGNFQTDEISFDICQKKKRHQKRK